MIYNSHNECFHDCRLYSRNKFHILQLRSTSFKLLTRLKVCAEQGEFGNGAAVGIGLWC